MSSPLTLMLKTSIENIESIPIDLLRSKSSEQPSRNNSPKATLGKGDLDYLEILKICDAQVALCLLVGLTTEEKLSDYTQAFTAIQALALFSDPNRLTVFIEALKLDRDAKTLKIDLLLERDASRQPENPFKDGLQEPIRKALQTEKNERAFVNFTMDADGNLKKV